MKFAGNPPIWSHYNQPITWNVQGEKTIPELVTPALLPMVKNYLVQKKDSMDTNWTTATRLSVSQKTPNKNFWNKELWLGKSYIGNHTYGDVKRLTPKGRRSFF
jgi:hypothetical protein